MNGYRYGIVGIILHTMLFGLQLCGGYLEFNEELRSSLQHRLAVLPSGLKPAPNEYNMSVNVT